MQNRKAEDYNTRMNMSEIQPTALVDKLSKIVQKMKSEERSSPQAFHLRGPVGIGKTYNLGRIGQGDPELVRIVVQGAEYGYYNGREYDENMGEMALSIALQATNQGVSGLQRALEKRSLVVNNSASYRSLLNEVADHLAETSIKRPVIVIFDDADSGAARTNNVVTQVDFFEPLRRGEKVITLHSTNEGIIGPYLRPISGNRSTEKQRLSLSSLLPQEIAQYFGVDNKLAQFCYQATGGIPLLITMLLEKVTTPGTELSYLQTKLPEYTQLAANAYSELHTCTRTDRDLQNVVNLLSIIGPFHTNLFHEVWNRASNGKYRSSVSLAEYMLSKLREGASYLGHVDSYKTAGVFQIHPAVAALYSAALKLNYPDEFDRLTTVAKAILNLQIEYIRLSQDIELSDLFKANLARLSTIRS